MNETEQVIQQLDAAAAIVAGARQVLADGRAVDLAGLDQRIAGLCEAARMLPEPAAGGLKPRLVALLDDVDRLAADVEAQRALLTKALGSLAARRHAVAAYGKSATHRK